MGIDTEPASAVLFDVDGVLIDSGDALRRVWGAWAQHHGLEPDVVVAATRGRRRIDTLRVVAPHLNPEEEHRRLDRLMADEESRIHPFPGAAELLRALPGDRWAIVTSSRERATTPRFVRNGLPVPRVRVCAEDVTQGKPSPEGYLRAATLLGVEPSRCVVVEDSPYGVDAGLAAGCTVYAVAVQRPPEQLRHAHACFRSLREITGPLLRHFEQ